MTIRLLGGWQPATELIHIPKRAPDLDIGPSGGGPSRCSSQPMREGRRREGEGREGKEGKEGISVIPFSRLLLPYMDLQSDNGARSFRPK